MVFLLVFVFLSSSITRLNENKLAYSAYLGKILLKAESCYKKAIRAAYERWIVIPANIAPNIAMCIRKVSEFLSNAVLANIFVLIILTYLVVGRILASVYDF